MNTKNFIKQWAIGLGLSAAIAVGAQAQNAETQTQDPQFNPVRTAVPSMQISPSARAAGMADMGVSTTPDVNSQYYNPAKYAFLSSKAGISMSYTPWFAKLVRDIKLMELGGYYKLGQDDNQALSASIRYFSFGKLEQFDHMAQSMGEAYPNEFAVDFGYSLQLSEDYSMAVALRYIRADNNLSSGENSSGNAFAADLAGFYNKYVPMGDAESLVTFGYNIKNIGTKISYNNGATSMFIPTNMSLGAGILYPFDDYNALSVNVEANKLLVPTPPIKNQAKPEEYDAAYKKYLATSSIGGIFTSLADAPGGFKEELQEVAWSAGAEYSYNNRFFIRAGYHYHNPYKGNLQFFTAGVGFKMNVFSIDASYLLSSVQSNPLDQTLRFTLSFDMDGIRSLLK
ncbi:MAG: type IX secretion system outer membrane channel protein PorV [Porphyromonas sp.]|nr:type IX secretion system outer membrane channel protein PorV [Porphyromonas sp.]